LERIKNSGSYGVNTLFTQSDKNTTKEPNLIRKESDKILVTGKQAKTVNEIKLQKDRVSFSFCLRKLEERLIDMILSFE